MQVRMKQQVLSPTVKHGEETDLSPQTLRIRGDGDESLARRAEENAINHSLVLEGDRGDLLRDSEYNMKIRHLQELSLAVLNPLRARQALALRAVPVATAVERIAFVAALITALEVAAEGCRPTLLNGGHDAPLRDGHRRAMLFTISCAVAAENMRHFQPRAIHSPAVQKY